MIKKNIFPKALLYIALVFFVCGSAISSPSKDKIIIASGTLSGVYYPAALKICSYILDYVKNTKYKNIKCEVRATGGSFNNLSLLDRKTVDFAFIQSDIVHDAIKSKGAFMDQEPHDNLRLVLKLFPESLNILSKDKSKVRTFFDLSGKKIGLNLNGSASKNSLSSILKYYGSHDPNMEGIEILHIHENQMQDKLCNNKVDAVVISSAHPNNTIREISKSCDVEFVTYDPIILEHLLAENPIYEREYLEVTSFYPSISKNFTTFATRAMIVTRDDVDQLKIDILKKAFRENYGKFLEIMPLIKKVKINDLFESSVLDSK